MGNLKSCFHGSDKLLRMILPFNDDIRALIKTLDYWAPYTHQVVWCMECSQVVNQEDNSKRKALSVDFQSIDLQTFIKDNE